MKKMKKLSVIIASMIFAMNTVNAADFSVSYEDDGITIAGETENVGDLVNVTVWDKNNELLYVDQTSLESSTQFQFKAGVEPQNGLKIKVGGSDEYSPFMQLLNGVHNYDTYYVSSASVSGANGTKDAPYASLQTAYNKAKEGDTIYIIGKVDWDITSTSTKKVTISGGILCFQSSNKTINVPLKLEDVQLYTRNNVVTVNKNIVIGEKVARKDYDINLTLNNVEAEIHSGNIASVSGGVVRLYKGIDNITVSNANAVIMEDCKYSNITANYVINNGRGGTAEYSNNKINITPDDGKYVSINGGAYKRSGVISAQGTYSISYDYDFKLHSAVIDGNTATVELSAYNRNSDSDKQNPILVVAIYDEDGKVVYINNKTISAGDSVRTDISLGGYAGAGRTVKFYLWDSFNNMCPLAEVITPVNTDDTELAYYVSPDGSDTNIGSFAKPFKTIAKAVTAAQAENAPVTVYLKDGIHKVDSVINITGEKISFKGMGNAVVSTGYEIPGSAFVEPDSDDEEDAAFLRHLYDQSVRDNIKKVSLQALGITDYGTIGDYAWGSNDDAVVAPVVTQDDQRMYLAMYPDSGYLRVGSASTAGDGTNPMMIQVSGGITRAEKWYSNEIYADGYIHNEWTDSRAKVIKSGSSPYYRFTAADASLKISPNYEKDGVVQKQRVRFINVPEEITMPGEWYLNRSTGDLYIYPYDGFSASSKITFNPEKSGIDSVFYLSGASQISFSGITFKNIGANVFSIKNSDNITIESCEFTDILGDGVLMEKSTDCLIRDNYLHHVSAGGFTISGGDASNLIKANNYVTNNVIHDFSIDKRTYTPAVTTRGCGNVVSHNEIYNSPHMAIGVGGIEFTVEYNDIHNVCTETADSGAIYGAQYQYLKNNVIRYNYFHDIHRNTDTGYEVVAVFFDGLWSSADVDSNIFYDVDVAVKMNGGRYNGVKNNFMIECDDSVIIYSQGDSYVGNMEAFRQTSMYKNLFYSPFRTEIWQKEFPDVYNMFVNPETVGRDTASLNTAVLKDEAFLPVGNSVIDNVFIGETPEPTLNGSANELTTVSGNITRTGAQAQSSYFVNYNHQQFDIKAGTTLYSDKPGFDAPEFEKIGVQR